MESAMRLVTWKELKTIYGIPYSAQHVARLEADNKFPKRLKLSAYRGGRVAWVAAEVEAWIETRLGQRSSP